jgi:multiple sugar transport system substrate-binding protein
MERIRDRKLSRRALLSAGAWGVGLAGTMALLQACGRAAVATAPPAASTGPTAAASAGPSAAAAPTAVPTSTVVPATIAAPAVSKKFNGQTIKIATSTEYYAYAMRQFRDQIEREGNVKLSIDVVPGTDLYTRNQTEYNAGATSYDVTMFLPFQLPDYAPHMEPIKALMDKGGLDLQLDDVLPTFRDYYLTWGGTQVAMSFDGDIHLLFYNKEAFENPDMLNQYKSKTGKELAPPTTWDDYAAIAQFFTETPWRKDGQKGFGTAEGFSGPQWWWQNRFSAYGGIYFDDALKPLINGKNGLLATENLVKVAAFAPPGSNNFGYQEAENALIKGDAAMSINWSSAFRSAQDKARSTTVGKIGAAVPPGALVGGLALPSHPSLATGWVLGIPKYGKNKDAAAYVVWFLSQPAVHTRFCLDPATGVDAYRTSALKDPQFAALYGQQYVDVINQGLQSGFPDLQVPGANEYYTKLQDGLTQAITKVKPVQAALDGVAAEWDKVSARVGKDKQQQAWGTALAAMKARGLDYKILP